MNRRQSTLLVLLLAGGCLAPHYGVDATDSGQAGGSSGAGNSGKPADAAAGQSDAGGAESLGGASNPSTGQGGDASEAGSPSTVSCDATEKECGGQCVALSDVAYGCGATTCNQSGCPADSEAILGCDGESCVAVGCSEGFKLCGSRCVSENDPTFGCGPTACDDTSCPDPGAATLTCSDGACVVGDCSGDSKKCGNKCVPKNEDNGCSAAGCEACATNEVCSGEPPVCACVPNGDPCAGFECGSATDSCGELKDCRNDCAGTAEPFCVGNTCRQCKVAGDCKTPPNNPCFKPACSNNGSCTLAVAAANTSCPGGGKCSATLPGVCERPAVTVGTFNIDATEVTRGQYAAFLKAKAGNTGGQIAACSWNTTYTPEEGWPGVPEFIDYPVASIDWCDAHAYCAWVGRRLCGKRGGGSAPFIVDHTGETAQWVHACLPASGGLYPYGSTFDVNACNGKASATAARVASYPDCVGGVPGLYDMSGNVSEWEDSCDGYTDEEDSCGTQGGSFGIADTGSHLVCTTGQGYRRDVAAPRIGFRCCSNP
jgi:formylglycine-generating enzyme